MVHMDVKSGYTARVDRAEAFVRLDLYWTAEVAGYFFRFAGDTCRDERRQSKANTSGQGSVQMVWSHVSLNQCI